LVNMARELERAYEDKPELSVLLKMGTRQLLKFVCTQDSLYLWSPTRASATRASATRTAASAVSTDIIVRFVFDMHDQVIDNIGLMVVIVTGGSLERIHV